MIKHQTKLYVLKCAWIYGAGHPQGRVFKNWFPFLRVRCREVGEIEGSPYWVTPFVTAA